MRGVEQPLFQGEGDVGHFPVRRCGVDRILRHVVPPPMPTLVADRDAQRGFSDDLEQVLAASRARDEKQGQRPCSRTKPALDDLCSHRGRDNCGTKWCFLGTKGVSPLRLPAGNESCGPDLPGLKLGALAVELISERMREQLNSNPLAQLAVVGVLLVAVGFFVMSSGGGEEEERKNRRPPKRRSASRETAPEPPAPARRRGDGRQASASAARPARGPCIAAWEANQTVVLLFVRDGGIDDRLVDGAAERLGSLPRRRRLRRPRRARSPATRRSPRASTSTACPALVVVTPEAAQRRRPHRLGQLRLPEPRRASSRRSSTPATRARRSTTTRERT